MLCKLSGVITKPGHDKKRMADSDDSVYEKLRPESESEYRSEPEDSCECIFSFNSLKHLLCGCGKTRPWEPVGSPVRKSILRTIRKVAFYLNGLLQKSNKTIEWNTNRWLDDLSNGVVDFPIDYKQEIEWHNNNRHNVLKGLRTVFDAYREALNMDYSDLYLEEDVLTLVLPIERDMRGWGRDRTEQYAMELNLKRAFTTHRTARSRSHGKSVRFEDIETEAERTDVTDCSATEGE